MSGQRDEITIEEDVTAMKQIETRHHRFWHGAYAAFLVALLASLIVAGQPSQARANNGRISNNGNGIGANGIGANGIGANGIGTDGALTSQQRAVLYNIARDTWNFYRADVDPHTHLPLDNLGYTNNQVTVRGAYTSAANIGVYLWAVVSANDLGLISRREARSEIAATLTEVSHLKRDNGFLYQWYDTTTGDVILNPGQADCSTEPTPTFDNCYFISNVDNGWYASGLVIVRSAMPELRYLADGLLGALHFELFYDNRPQTPCNVNTAITGNQPTGQMFGGYYVGLPVDQGDNWKHYYHNGALYSDPRISAYIGMGLRQMPGDVWWRSWRVLPPKQCPDDPDFSWQGQWPVPGYWQVYNDPQSGKPFNVWEGHYTYPGTDLTFVPTFAGGMFEGLMPNLVVPETSWGPQSFGLNDRRWARVQVKYTTEQLHYPVWGLSPSSTPDDTGNYGGYGVDGLVWPSAAKKGLSQAYGAASETTLTPHASFIALDVLPRQAYANIQALRTLYPDSYRADGGFYDAVAPTAFSYSSNNTTYNVSARQVGHRDLVLDQSMIMAALDNVLNDHALQRHFARDPVSWAAHLYLSSETMSIAETATGTGTPTSTGTATATLTATSTQTIVPTLTVSGTQTVAAAGTPSATSTSTSVPTATDTSVPTATPTGTTRPADTATTTPTGTPTNTATGTPTNTATTTVVPAMATGTITSPPGTATGTPTAAATAPSTAPSGSPTPPSCQLFVVPVLSTVPRGGTQALLLDAAPQAPLTVTVRARYPTTATLYTDRTLADPNGAGGVDLAGRHVRVGYQYAFQIEQSGLALLTFAIPGDARQGTVAVGVTAQEPCGVFRTVATFEVRGRVAGTAAGTMGADGRAVTLAVALPQGASLTAGIGVLARRGVVRVVTRGHGAGTRHVLFLTYRPRARAPRGGAPPPARRH